MKKITTKEYMCSWCGKKVRRSLNAGRPEPGTCSKRSTTGRTRPHSWVVNRTL